VRSILRSRRCPRHYWRGFLILTALAAGGRAESLDAIFARMDEASKKFKSASAKLHQADYMAVIDETTQEDGQLRMKRSKNGVMLRVEFSKPNARLIALDGHILWIYYPKANTAERYDVNKYTSTNTIEQLLLLSFGAASGAELRANYTVSAGGTETIDSKVTTKVELVPKSEKMRKEITRITLWIPEGLSNALKERVDKPGKNYITWTYTDVNLKQPVSDSEVTLKLPKDVHVVGAK
jgi:outer membrane lipoprotein-sorting protein